MRVEVLNVAVESKGKYRVAKVDFKNVESGKVDGKQLMSFVFKDVFTAFSEAKQGDVFDVKPVKNDKGYWDWTEATPAGKNTGSTGQAKSEGFAQAVRSGRDFETSEERAKKQVYIVRQSSITAAIELNRLNGAQRPVTVEDVVNTAKEFEAYVFSIGPVNTPEVE
jgi:hypothetical protein